MSARPARGIPPGILAIALLLGVPLAGPARAATWQDLFAAEAESVLVLGADGALYRAPFHLAARETLWQPQPGERLVRLRVSPRGAGFALLSRLADGDTTRLWIASDGTPRPRARYATLKPHQLGRLQFESAVPTVRDRGFRGARWLAPSVMSRRFTTTTLEWTPEGSGVVFGTAEGLAFAPVDTGHAREVSAALAFDLTSLEPSPVFHLDAIVLREGMHRDVGLLLYPDFERWRLFPDSGLDGAADWTASATTVWWASGKTIRAVHAHSPTPGTEVEAKSPVVWLEHDAARNALTWVSGRHLMRRAADGGAEIRVAELPQPVTAVLEPPIGARRGLVAGTSLHVWEPATDTLRTTPLGDFVPESMWELADGEVLVFAHGGRGKAARLARTRTGRLEPITMPKAKNPVLAQSPSRTYVLVADVGSAPPERVHVLDPALGTWTVLTNPGITAWELLRPR